MKYGISFDWKIVRTCWCRRSTWSLYCSGTTSGGASRTSGTAAMFQTRGSGGWVFKGLGHGVTLEPKWHGHFGNYIDNTLLALHKFQAKKQVFPNRTENDRNGNSSNCIRRPGPFAMQLALRLCFCLMPIASISTSSQKIRNAVVVSHVKIHPNRRSGDTTTPHRRMEPERRLFPPLPRCKTLTAEEGGSPNGSLD